MCISHWIVVVISILINLTCFFCSFLCFICRRVSLFLCCAIYFNISIKIHTSTHLLLHIFDFCFPYIPCLPLFLPYQSFAIESFPVSESLKIKPTCCPLARIVHVVLMPSIVSRLRLSDTFVRLFNIQYSYIKQLSVILLSACSVSAFTNKMWLWSNF